MIKVLADQKKFIWKLAWSQHQHEDMLSEVPGQNGEGIRNCKLAITSFSSPTSSPLVPSANHSMSHICARVLAYFQSKFKDVKLAH